MAASTILPTYQRSQASGFAGGRRFLRLSEKYFVALVLLCFAMVLLGAVVYLPQDELKSNLGRGADEFLRPAVAGAHGSADDVHKVLDRRRFAGNVEVDRELQAKMTLLMDQLRLSREKLDLLKQEIEANKIGAQRCAPPVSPPVSASALFRSFICLLPLVTTALPPPACRTVVSPAGATCDAPAVSLPEWFGHPLARSPIDCRPFCAMAESASLDTAVRAAVPAMPHQALRLF